MQLRKFIANILCLFIPNKKIRHKLRDSFCRPRVSKQKYINIKQQWKQHGNGEKLLPARFEKYDLVFGIGATCHVRRYLDIFKLARFTTPLDWTAGAWPCNFDKIPGIGRDSRFREKIECLYNDFNGYYNPEDMRIVNLAVAPGIAHQHIVNIKTGIFIPHIFPFDVSMEQYMPTFRETIKRRADRLINAIKQSDKILIVWMNHVFDYRTIHDLPVPDIDIINAVKRLNKKFAGKQIDFVFFEHDGTKDKFEYEKQEVAPGAYRILSNHFFLASEYGYKYKLPSTPFFIPSLCIAEALDNISLTGKKVVD